MKMTRLEFWRHRFSPVFLLAAFSVSVSLITRTALLIKSYADFENNLSNFIGVFAWGFFYDLVQTSYFIIPLTLYLWLVSGDFLSRKIHRVLLFALFSLFLFVLLFNAAAEWFFWDEFSTRFNFIAVDYLVYTTEVIGNISQSYPITWIVIGIIVFSGLLTYWVSPILKLSSLNSWNFLKTTKWMLVLMIVPLLDFVFVSSKFHHFSQNTYANELSGNGMYELFAAYRSNELNFDQFYPTISEPKAFKNIRTLLRTSDVNSVANVPFSIEHQVVHEGSEKRLNVVLISMESFSASFMKYFGNQQNITPFLDSLTTQSLVFTNLYATGTRTVRGLEALSLCVPPTPGQSIVRRPQNEHLFSLATVFNEKGYESKFIYGGYGYFDNMSYFFENNGYTVVDRSALAEDEIDYENIWGVADENLFTLALREIDNTTASGKPAFAHIMTTSNHRPFTYPDGRIDIPSQTGRNGAVKYTDYAVGKFIREAKRKPWFNNTIFIITADHCASSAGKTELPVEKYHIPMLIYAADIQPGTETRLMSQIDIGPTILGILNFSYTSKFFGSDIHSIPAGYEHAFVSTYQLLGYLRSGNLVVLAPNKKPEINVLQMKNSELNSQSKLIEEAISWYETASYSFSHGLMNEK